MPEENVLKMNLTPDRAKRILNDIIQSDSSRVFLTNHAKKRMIERAITRKQAICCLLHGQFFEEPYRSAKGNWEMTLDVLSAGDPLRVTCALDNDKTGNYIIIITAI